MYKNQNYCYSSKGKCDLPLFCLPIFVLRKKKEEKENKRERKILTVDPSIKDFYIVKIFLSKKSSVYIMKKWCMYFLLFFLFFSIFFFDPWPEKCTINAIRWISFKRIKNSTKFMRNLSFRFQITYVWKSKGTDRITKHKYVICEMKFDFVFDRASSIIYLE